MKTPFRRRAVAVTLACLVAPFAFAADPTFELQPFAAQVKRVQEALDYLGAPLTPAQRDAFAAAAASKDQTAAVAEIQRVLDPLCLFRVTVNAEMRVRVQGGPAPRVLDEKGWRIFLVKVVNEAGATGALQIESPNAYRLYNAPADDVPNRWLEAAMFDAQPLQPSLGGLPVEYRIVQLYSRDAGRREAKILFNIGHGTQDLGFRNETDLLFNCRPARPVTLRVLDENGKPTTASFLIKDHQGRIYPAPAKRLAPDFAFHPQVYRADGEQLGLPDGTYTVEFSRGPESIARTTTLTVDANTKTAEFRVERWIDPSLSGWWSGDHHIHAAGCLHYVKPVEGVHAEDMIRHVMGEDLKVGANLTWGPCFDYQKQFFCGAVDRVSVYPYLLRYDIEVSGFGSHQSGHLCLLRLREQMYPGGTSSDHWPTLCLNTLRWAKKQGAVVGPAHSGWGLQPATPGDRTVAGSSNSTSLQLATTALPNYVVPPFNGIGANEYIVDVTHTVPGPDGALVPAVDFISTVDTPYAWELNIWYHTLNAGFRTRISGETDFPCIYGERVGIGRSYVYLGDKLDYDQWCEGIRLGRNYVSDGKSHLMEFKANDVAMGFNGSELKLAAPGKVHLTAKVAAHLAEQPDEKIRRRPAEAQPYWDIERARVGDTREVPVEVIVNGIAVAKKNIVADGHVQDVAFDVEILRSSWVALRVLPSSHTNPIFVLVGDKPIRASRRSVEWCLAGVENCWREKERFIKPAEMDDAKAAYAHARETYQRLLTECTVD